MSKLYLLALFFTLFLVYGKSQSIPSYWMNLYELENYYELKQSKAKKIIAHYRSDESHNAKWVYNILEDHRIMGELIKNGQQRSRFIYHLDSLGRRVKHIIDFKNNLWGWQKEIYVFEYAEGKKVSEKHHNGKGDLMRTAIFEYDDKGRPIKLSVYNSNSHLESFETAKYEDMQYIYKVFDSDERLVLSETRYYNMDVSSAEKNINGDYTKLMWPTSKAGSKVHHEFEYVYDAIGNWIKRTWTIVANGEKRSRSIVKRKIKY